MTDHEKREARIRMLLDSGFSRSDAEVADDLAMHAAHEAVLTLVRITDSAYDPEIRMVSRVTAMQLVQIGAGYALQQILSDMIGPEPQSEAVN